MNRRAFLGGAVGAAAAGGLLLASGQTAMATAQQNYDPVSVTTDDGEVNYVAVYGDSVVSWSGFDEQARSFDILSEVEIEEPSGSTLWSGQINRTDVVSLTQDSWGGPGESHSGPGTSGTIESDVGLDQNGEHDPAIDWEIVQDANRDSGYALPANPAPAEYLTVSEDGGEETYVVRLLTTYTWYSGIGGSNEVHSETFVSEVPVTVTNAATSTSASTGDGTDGAVAG